MFRFMIGTLLVTFTLGAPQFDDGRVLILERERYTPDAPLGWSEEETTTKLNLEDVASWSASTEVEDENHAWFRRRRSAESRVDAAEDVKDAADDLEAAESVVFMPAHLRHSKKMAHEECRRRRNIYAAQRRHHSAPVRNHCNSYCCYPVALV
ncbi:uncharacterized protein LOC128996921 [Macrosteles quadrilineatus]|uniref:uncharacterized protein LOC128996921 n=1 Tax=Macrosteles quadrilineatus TaxID=74068 RepID=UPI0023E0A738|nr:uncharacterized protein LOC128996921 [Macrosteles quadrilineatus]